MTPGIVAESELNGNLQSEYVFFDGERVARKDFPGNAVSYYFSDHLKTTDIVTDAQGNIKNESDYYPWGGELPFVANDSNHYKFTGKERDSETGLDYFGARYYSNGLGRFITPDWAAKAAADPYAAFADPQSLNLYTYVRNIPTTLYDADGHDDDKSAFEAFVNAVNDFLHFAVHEWQPHGAGALPPPGCGCPPPGSQKGNEHNENNSKSDNANGENGGSNQNKGGREDSRTAEDGLRREANGKAIPDPEAEGAAHSQLGTRTSKSQAGNPKYKEAMEFDANGKPVRQIQFTNHGRKTHPNPHQHKFDPKTGKRGKAEPL